MASNSVAKASLIVTTDSTQMQKGLEDAKKKISGFSLSLGKGVNFFSTGGLMTEALAGFKMATGFIESLANQITEAGDKAENMINLANAFGVGAEEMQRLELSAKLSNVELTQLEKNLRAAAEIAGAIEVTPEMRKKLQPLNLEPSQLQGMAPQQALQAITDGLSKIQNKSEQIAAATDIFGARNATAALIMMKENTLGFANELKGLGVTIDDVLGKKMADAADKITIAQRQWEAGKTGFMGWLIDLTDWIDENTLVGAFRNIAQEANGAMEKIHAAKVEAIRLQADQRRAIAEGLESARKQADFMQSFKDVDKAQFDLGFEAMRPQMEAAKKFLKPDALQESQLAFQGLNLQFNEGWISANQYADGLSKLQQELEGVKQASNELRLPTAITKGSIADIQASNQDYAFSMRNVGNDGNDKIADQLKRDAADAKRREGLLKEIRDALKPVANLKEI